MTFFIKDDEVWKEYDEIWDVSKNKLSLKFIANLFTNKNT